MNNSVNNKHSSRKLYCSTHGIEIAVNVCVTPKYGVYERDANFQIRTISVLPSQIGGDLSHLPDARHSISVEPTRVRPGWHLNANLSPMLCEVFISWRGNAPGLTAGRRQVMAVRTNRCSTLMICVTTNRSLHWGMKVLQSTP